MMEMRAASFSPVSQCVCQSVCVSIVTPLHAAFFLAVASYVTTPAFRRSSSHNITQPHSETVATCQFSRMESQFLLILLSDNCTTITAVTRAVQQRGDEVELTRLELHPIHHIALVWMT